MIQGHTSSPCTLEARQLSVVLGGQKVLEIPSLQLFSDETLVIIGPNGSGKTTLLLCMALLLRPTTGSIAFQGIPVEDGSSILRLRRRFAVVFQEPLLLDASVWDNVSLGLRLRGVRRGETKERAQAWLERFGIASLEKRRARTLSGGEAKRASLARAFALKPEVLFLDEPFAALDGPTRQSLIEDLGGVLRETKVSTIMVTHDRNEA
ncbi:MAG: ATP-binding cassette domain-containing protein, partial [Chloroflexota bacterium]